MMFEAAAAANNAGEDESEDLKYAREEVALCPRNAQCRLDLALALEEAGLLRFAYAEARAATTLTPKYGRAWKARSRLETLLPSQEIDDDDGPYLQTPLDNNEAVAASVNEEEIRAQSPEEALSLSQSLKSAGNEHFVAKRHAEAVKAWTAAIELLKLWSLPVDAKLFSNRAAANLKLNKNVLAVADARLSAEADPGWWKAHWYLGQALSAQLVVSASQRGACTSNGERAQEAYRWW
jgi:tetratricopeptide (TPR) repeat protein